MDARRWATCAMATALAVAAVSGCGKSAPSSAPASQGSPPATGAGSFNSGLAFDVYVVKTFDEKAHLIGRTPSEKGLEIPRCLFWFVEVVGTVDMAKVCAEIRAKPIPGLRLAPTQGDKDLFKLEGLAALQMLSLEDTRVTDVGLEHLKGLTALQTLVLSGTEVTDAGLAHLKNLTALKMLDLLGTKVTDAGLEDLKGLTALQTLGLAGTKVTDAGLAHLKNLTALKTLDLRRTNVTNAGIAELKEHLPNADILGP